MATDTGENNSKLKLSCYFVELSLYLTSENVCDSMDSDRERTYCPNRSLKRGSSSMWYLRRYPNSSSVPNTLAILTS